MGSAAAALLVVAGCSFAPGSASAPSTPLDGHPAATADAAVATTDTPPPPISCDDGAGDTSLRLCLDFEDMPLASVAHDLSPFHHDAALVAVQPMARGTQHAVQVGPSSSIEVPATADLALVSAFTVELWVNTTTVANHDGLIYPLENMGFFAIEIDDAGNLECNVGGYDEPTEKKVTTGDWVHVACAFDSNGLRMYVQGNAQACFDFPGGSTTTPVPTMIGASYVGGIDDVHVYARGLTDSEICLDATGDTHCQPCD